MDKHPTKFPNFRSDPISITADDIIAMPRPQPLMMQCCCLKSSSLLRPDPYGTASRASMRAASTFSSITKALSPSPRMSPRGRVLSADVITAQVGPPIRSATNRLLAQINRGTAGGSAWCSLAPPPHSAQHAGALQVPRCWLDAPPFQNFQSITNTIPRRMHTPAEWA